MKHLLTVAACSLLMTFGQTAQASPQEDAALIADALITDELEAQFLDIGLATYLDGMSGLLLERSVRVADDTTYRDLISPHYAALADQDIHASAVEKLLAQSPDELKSLAAFVRSNENMPAQTAVAQEIPLEEFKEHIETQLEEVETMLESGEFEMGFRLAAIGLAVAMEAQDNIRNIEADLTAPFMADILETDGVFQFPNRIYRKDLIAEIRAANP